MKKVLLTLLILCLMAYVYSWDYLPPFEAVKLLKNKIGIELPYTTKVENHNNFLTTEYKYHLPEDFFIKNKLSQFNEFSEKTKGLEDICKKHNFTNKNDLLVFEEFTDCCNALVLIDKKRKELVFVFNSE
jgi:hypothetical protein